MNKVKLLFLALSLWGLYHVASSFCYQRTDGFSVARIHSELTHNPAWEIAPLSEERQKILDAAFSQEFRYMACGGQCFAFGSEDGKYVIKFFKHKIRKPYSYWMRFPLPESLAKVRERKRAKGFRKLSRDFTSYKSAYEDLQEETGLLYIHLNKGTSLHRSITIVDKIGIKHQIPLDGIEFVLQNRAELVYSHIEKLTKRGDAEGAKRSLRAILDVIVSRCKKGYFDEDPRIHRNFGFIGDKSIIIDVGRFIPDANRKDPAIYKADVLAITKGFRKWLSAEHPELISALDEELHVFQAQN